MPLQVEEYHCCGMVLLLMLLLLVLLKITLVVLSI